MVLYNRARDDSGSKPGGPLLQPLDASLAKCSNIFPFDCTIPGIRVCWCTADLRIGRPVRRCLRRLGFTNTEGWQDAGRYERRGWVYDGRWTLSKLQSSK